MDKEEENLTLDKLSKQDKIMPSVLQMVTVMSKFGASAADMAAENGHKELAAILRNFCKSPAERAQMRLADAQRLGPKKKREKKSSQANSPVTPSFGSPLPVR